MGCSQPSSLPLCGSVMTQHSKRSHFKSNTYYKIENSEQVEIHSSQEPISTNQTKQNTAIYRVKLSHDIIRQVNSKGLDRLFIINEDCFDIGAYGQVSECPIEMTFDSKNHELAIYARDNVAKYIMGADVKSFRKAIRNEYLHLNGSMKI